MPRYRRTPEQQLASAHAALARAEARATNARSAAWTRDTRVKVLIGAAMLLWAGADAERRRSMSGILNSRITDPASRALLTDEGWLVEEVQR